VTQLLTIYEKKIKAGLINEDSQQRIALEKLQHISNDLNHNQRSWLFGNKKVKGLYFYGSVGIGKTFLMDLFFDNLLVNKKLRMHFHRFMQQVDKQLRALQGTPEPLQKVAKSIARKTSVLCFDEFFVSDIADAMILGRLFDALFKLGITLIATSNIPPDKLYWNGLHRKRFLPTIELIKQHCEVFGFESSIDYRLQTLFQEGVYFTKSDAQIHMLETFQLLTHGINEQGAKLCIENRKIKTRYLAEHVVWFDFNVICNIPRSQLDYLKIAERFDVVLVSAVPIIDDTAAITYFINLVDVFYDEGVQLILSAESEPEALYRQDDKRFEYRRTVSRLIEMQSKEYIEKANTHALRPINQFLEND
jgi:cell division protein ZapE